jgi:hypothetical protein
MTSIAVPYTGILTWQPVFNYDNYNNSAEIKHTLKAKIFESYSTRDVMEKVSEYTRTEAKKGKVGFQVGAVYKIISANIDMSYENSKEIRDFVSKHVTQQTDYKRESEYEEIRECKRSLADSALSTL